MECQDCGATYADTEGHYVQDGCPNCGGFRFQVSPTHSEMELRNMPDPGELDMGGNPLQEGIFGETDGGWKNRMKRDESYASTKRKWMAAPVPGPTYDHSDTYWKHPYYQRGLYNNSDPSAEDLAGYAEDLAGGAGSRGTLDTGAQWEPGMFGRGLLDESGKVHTWPEEMQAPDGTPMTHYKYMEHKAIPSAQAMFNVDPEGTVRPYGDVGEEHWPAILQDSRLNREVAEDPSAGWSFASHKPKYYSWLYAEAE